MRKLLIGFALLGLLTGCSGAFQPAYLPILKVDAAHYRRENYYYQIPAGKGFVLDASNYKFENGSFGDPNYVRVQVGHHLYSQRWNPEMLRQSVTVDKLQPVAGTTPLNKFDPNTQVVVTIGEMNNRGSFHPFWSGVIVTK